MPEYVTVTCRLPAVAEERLTEAMQGWPVLGCQVEDVGAELAVTVYLEGGQSTAAGLVSDGLVALGAAELVAAPFAGQDWLAEYRQRVTPRALGRHFWIDPHPQRPTPAPPGRRRLVIEPRQAFGTGSHESTQLVILQLEDDPPEGEGVLDVGTGSGILAIAALALGARWVVALDIDPEAVFVALQTAAIQPEPRPVALLCGSVACLSRRHRFDLVLANLLPSQATPLLPVLGGILAARGRLLLSGLMLDQRAAVEADLAAAGLAVAGARELGEWVALVCRRP